MLLEELPRKRPSGRRLLNTGTDDIKQLLPSDFHKGLFIQAQFYEILTNKIKTQ
jgi:hypothetical protein